jgi:uncharacterized protein YpiB (UPF0302 family)
MQDRVYFGGLKSAMTQQFFQHFHKYLMSLDLSKFDSHNIPFTFAKADMIVENADAAVEFIVENYDDLCVGINNKDMWFDVFCDDIYHYFFFP